MKRKTKKSLALVVSLVLIITTVVGGTLAFIMDKTPEIKNTFEPSKITTSVEEDLEGSIKKNVMIKNTGDTEGPQRRSLRYIQRKLISGFPML